jgi:hypothetical protein
LKTLIHRQYSFQKLTPYSHGNKVLDARTSNIDIFYLWDTCVSTIHLNRCAFLPLENPYLQAVFLSKTNSILKENHVLDTPPYKVDGFLSRDTCVSTIHLKRPIWNKMCFSPHRELCWAGSIPFKINSILRRKQCARWSTY